MSRAYYNEIEPYAAQWLRNLIAERLIAPGDVDDRSIVDVQPSDIAGYTQCHFFAGLGGWSHALRLAGWPDGRPVWTGSCPCQPFSAAGKGGGFADERHLWPSWFHLIRECRPSVVFGEQVASKDGLGWLDLVQADLEGSGYACGATDLCAAGIGAPHIRQRQWWIGERMADAGSQGLAVGSVPDVGRGTLRVQGSSIAAHELPGRVADTSCERGDRGANPSGTPRNPGAEVSGGIGGMADRHCDRCAEAGQREPSTGNDGPVGDSAVGRMSHGNGVSGDQGGALMRGRDPRGDALEGARPCGGDGLGRPGPVNGLWRDADWLFCRDGKWRPVEPGTSPLAHGIPARVGRLRAYGNAIVPQCAQAFIEAYMSLRP